MLFKWPIRTKLFACLGLLLVVVILLSWGGISGLYAYRGLVRSLGRRVPELPLANQFSHDISELRIALNESRTSRELELTGHEISPMATRLARQEFRIRVQNARETLEKYRRQLLDNPTNSQIGDSRQEWMTVQAIQESLARVDQANLDEDWLLDEIHVGKLTNELEYLQQLAAELPSYLYKKINDFSEEARGQYRSLITLTVTTTVAAIVMFIVFIERFYQWIFRPLRILVRGSRKVASGQFHHRIHLHTHDEMSELAQAMNDMTERFQTIRDDLDRQVQERSREVIRSEQLASVGFLAAGVAHEINNPLAAIALCADSLEERVSEQLGSEHPENKVIHQYLKMIQDEAFRCKGITEKLLDFSRIGEVRRQSTDLRELVQGVIEMLQHMNKYHEKQVELLFGSSLLAPVNSQQLKQVVLNLIVNGLDSLGPGGKVRVSVAEEAGEAVLTISDDGCGMTPEVLEHLFEPFFTRRRNGQGTGLGLSIVHRIVTDHEGSIEVYSAGPGKGSRFRVRLPLVVSHNEESNHRYQAA